MPECTVCRRCVAFLHPMVPSCMPCILFFERALTKTPLDCTRVNRCFKTPNVLLDCRKCRFEKCLEMGMKRPEKSTEHTEHTESK